MIPRLGFAVVLALLTACPNSPSIDRPPGLQPFAGRWAIFPKRTGASSWVGRADEAVPAFGSSDLTRLREAVAQQFKLAPRELSRPMVTMREGGERQVEFRQRADGLPINDAGIILHFGSDDRLLYVRETFLPSAPAPAKPAMPLDIDAFVRRAIGSSISAEGGVLHVRTVSAPFLHGAAGKAQWAVKAYIEVIRNAQAAPTPYDAIIALSTEQPLAIIEHLHRADPPARVFRPTPLSLCKSSEYGTVSLSPTYRPVTLPRLNTGATVPNGAYAEFKDLDGVANPAWTACNGAGVCNFEFFWLNQSDPLEQRKFSEVMTYFLIDDVLTYVQSDLGFSTLAVDRPIAVDVVADGGTHYAFYLHKPASKKGLYFGFNNRHSVATDGKVVVHEYAHALQAADVGERLSYRGDPIAIREGFADYFAVSTFAGLESSDCRTHIAAFMNSGSGLRNVEKSQTYPPTGNDHERGLVWARALFLALETIQVPSGWEAARRIVDRGAILGHQELGRATSVPTMPEMAEATLAAVRNDSLTSPHVDAFCDAFVQQKILTTGSCAALKTLPVTIPPLPP